MIITLVYYKFYEITFLHDGKQKILKTWACIKEFEESLIGKVAMHFGTPLRMKGDALNSYAIIWHKTDFLSILACTITALTVKQHWST